MTNQQEVVERLSQFNNMSFTKKQWDIILKGCGCPKSSHFWNALKNNNLTTESSDTKCKIYTLKDMDMHSYAIIWEEYCTTNKTFVKKRYNKAKAKAAAQKRSEEFQGLTFYMVGGILTTEIPERDI